jgi:hypothetical protein
MFYTSKTDENIYMQKSLYDIKKMKKTLLFICLLYLQNVQIKAQSSCQNTYSFTTYPESCAGCCNGAAIISYNGNCRPYTVHWSNTSTSLPLDSAGFGFCCGQTYSVTVYDNNYCCPPQTYTWTCGCSNQTTGVNQLSETNDLLKIYPNPAINKIIVEAKEIDGIKLYNVLGTEIIRIKENEIDVSNLTNGVYFIQVQTKQNTTTQKIIVQH